MQREGWSEPKGCIRTNLRREDTTKNTIDVRCYEDILMEERIVSLVA
jgi:hypothetical protein